MDASKTMPFVLLTAARNEQGFIERTIESVVTQTVAPLRWVIANDGSTDKTPAIIDRYAARYPWIERLDMPEHRDRSFAAKAYCINAAYEHVKQLDFEVIGNLDADVSFDSDFFEFLLPKFVDAPELGIAGTIFHEDGYDSSVDSFEGENYVAGMCQLFRRACFEDIGGYTPHAPGGVDWIAVMSARMKGWKVRAFREKHFFHHRSMGTAERGSLAALYSYGKKDYYLGNHPLWELLRVIYRLGKKPYLSQGVALGAGYLSAAIHGIHRPISPELMRFHRKEQMRKLRGILHSLLHCQRVDNFTITSSE
ncbi:MAG: glycosyltransferase family 2 protein [Syntrophobacteraceae bacterium]|nr:glycosyltransferase family 2 protein [Syntrophobacteraceae bacterium]